MKNRIEYKGFYIDKTENGYRISRKEDTEKHTHLSNLNPSYRLIDNVLSNKIPTRCGCYYLESHIRLSYDENYIRKIREYIEVKQNKTKQMYFNPGRKRSAGIFNFMEGKGIMVDSKIKKATVSAAKKNITASGVRIENGVFVDDEGSIVERVAEKLPEGTTIFDIKISIEISDEESDSAE